MLLRSILINLMENAVDYTPPHGVIRIEPGPDGSDRFHVRITNNFTVDTLTAEDLPKLFDRFWRHDAARTGDDHSGLGLPLARAFAVALGYELAATIEPDEHLLVLILRGPRTNTIV